MNPVEKAKEALSELVEFYDHYGNMPENQAKYEEALEALRSMQEVDVEGLINPDGDTMGGLVKSRGWNEAVRHISQNYHLIPKE